MLAKTPPMGFNTWNTFGGEISDSVIRETADAMVDTGLRDAGYEYLVIDDFWSKRERDPITNKIVPDEWKFPNGMKAVSDYVHSKGLKFGMYSCAGVRTCGDFPGSFDHEFLDAETFAEYGVDFLKYDYCNLPDIDGNLMYYRMGLALRACGREILFSACNWGCNDVGRWIRSTGAHMYRSTGDINDSFQSVKDLAFSQFGNECFAAPGCFNDIDMLTVGMHGAGNVANGGCTDEEYYTHFALWCMMGSPLMIGCDIRKASEATLKILKNKELIRINQDEEARPCHILSGHSWDDDNRKILIKPLANNEYAFGFFNFSDGDGNLMFYSFDSGLAPTTGYAWELTDIETGECIGRYNDYLNLFVKAHQCRIFRAKIVKL